MQELIFNVFPWETRAYVFESGVLENAFVEWSDKPIFLEIFTKDE